MGRIIIVGKAGSGKDYLKNKFVARGFKRAISHTTRPMREGEVEGVDYEFISEAEFIGYIHMFYEHKQFNSWYYGTALYVWKTAEIFIMTPAGIADIDPIDRKDCMVIYLDIPLAVRRGRLLGRSDADSIDRRIAADEADFACFKDFDVRITNPMF